MIPSKAFLDTVYYNLYLQRRPVSPPLPCCIGSMTNVCVNCGAIKWKGEAPGTCCPPGEAGHCNLYINAQLHGHIKKSSKVRQCTCSSTAGSSDCMKTVFRPASCCTPNNFCKIARTCLDEVPYTCIFYRALYHILLCFLLVPHWISLRVIKWLKIE